jgi:hypothetical protein
MVSSEVVGYLEGYTVNASAGIGLMGREQQLDFMVDSGLLARRIRQR